KADVAVGVRVRQELAVADEDGSGTVAMCREVAEKFARVRVPQPESVFAAGGDQLAVGRVNHAAEPILVAVARRPQPQEGAGGQGVLLRVLARRLRGVSRVTRGYGQEKRDAEEMLPGVMHPTSSSCSGRCWSGGNTLAFLPV